MTARGRGFWRRAGGRLLTMLVSLSLVACGLKGPPVAPELRIPRPPTELKGSVQARQVAIEWSPPTRREDGSRIRDLTSVRLYRREDIGEGPPRPAMRVDAGVNGFAEVATLDRRVTRYVDGDVAIGRRYTYVLTSADSQGRMSAPSVRLSLAVVAAPRPPADLVIREGEAEATLVWQPPRELIDGSAASGTITYEVLRSASPDVPPAEIRATGLATPRFTDTRLENERTYFYAVRATRTETAGAAASEPTAPVAVTPRDMTPPSPPTDLVAVPSPGTARLSWRASPEADVARVIVYRVAGDGAPQRVGSVEAPRTTFVDQNVPAGTYRYFVTAVDTASRPNESARSGEVTAVIP